MLLKTKMKPPPWYRMWIYSVNFLLIIFQLIFLISAYFILKQPRFDLIPIDLKDISVITTFIGIGVQFFACFCAIIGVFLSNRKIVNIYWCFMIPLITFDIISAIVWSIKFHYIHKDIIPYMNDVIQYEVDHKDTLEPFCNEWKSIHNNLNCCPKTSIRYSCDYNWLNCHTTEPINCTVPILQWMHTQIDPLVVILYFLLTPLKMAVVIVLREDILELYTEIFYRGNPSLISSQWISIDSDDEQESITVVSSQNSNSSKSNESQQSLLQKKYSSSKNYLKFNCDKEKQEENQISPSKCL